MGFFYISAPLLEHSAEATHQEINDVVIKKSIADGKQMFIDRKKFKLANLDTLMMVNDKLLKIENNVESFLKKIDRQYLDLQQQTHHNWFVKFDNKQVPATQYLYDFKWNQAKYPRAYPLPRIVETIQAKVNAFETELRNKTNSYNDTKSQLTQNTQREGNYYVRDMTDLLVEPNVSPRDFVYSKFITTLIVIVPSVSCAEFQQGHNQISNYVIPGSAKRLGVPEKDGLTVWKINVFVEKIDERNEEDMMDNGEEEEQAAKKKGNKKNLTPVQEVIEKAREKFKVVAREFKFEAGLADQRKKKKTDLENKLKSQNKAVSDICLAYFSESYELYGHAKMLRLIVETNMRFGSDQTVIYLIETQQGKQKNVQSLLVDIFGDKDSQGLYGTKDQIQDSEDFFPFIYVPCFTF